MEIFFVLLHLWVAGICQAKNLPLVMAATEPTAVMEGSEFDKAFAVVNAMFEQVANTPGTGQRPGRDLIWNEQPAPPDPIDWREQPALTISSKEPPTNQHYIKAKDSDFILLDPFDDDDRNAAALSKMLHGSYRNRRRDYEDQVAEPVPLVSPESGEEHDVAATDSKEQDDDPGATEGDGEEDQGEQDDQGEEDEDPADHEPETKDQDDEEEEDEEDGGAPLEGAPVTEDLDDFPPETFMPPTVLGIARHYKVGSSFSVFPVHIPNAPEHIELGSGVPDEDGEEETEDEAPAEDGEAPAEDGEAPEEDGEAPAEEEGEAPAEDGEEGEDLDPNATTSHYFIIEPATSLDDEEETADSSKKGEDKSRIK